jgi:hypothetical protein
MNTVKADYPSDDVATSLALGVIAYVGETLLHEGVGHGGACLLLGGRITVLAPLWMRCSVDASLLEAAGPAANLLAACLFLSLIWLAPPRAAALRQFLWLSFAFNSLVACGYLVVGGCSGFGDWGVLFKAVRPTIVWRAPAVIAGLAGYYGSLVIAASAYRRLAGTGDISRRQIWARAVVPAVGAACVAVAAEIVGGRVQLGSLVLALGCTLFVGLSLTRMPGIARQTELPAISSRLSLELSPALITTALIVATAFVVVIGPGVDLSRVG